MLHPSRDHSKLRLSIDSSHLSLDSEKCSKLFVIDDNRTWDIISFNTCNAEIELDFQAQFLREYFYFLYEYLWKHKIYPRLAQLVSSTNPEGVQWSDPRVQVAV